MKKVPFDLETFKKCGKAETRDGRVVLYIGMSSDGKQVAIDTDGSIGSRYANGRWRWALVWTEHQLDLTHCLVESKRRPYKSIDEVPVDHWFRMSGTRSVLRVVGMLHRPGEVLLGAEANGIGFADLSARFEHSATIAGPWEPCTVEDCE